MPIKITWHNEDRGIAYIQLIGHWNMKQFREAWARGQNLMREQAHERVDFVLDLRQSILIPPDFVRQFRQMPYAHAQNLGLVIFIGTDESLQLLIEAIIQSLPYHLEVSFAETMDEAVAQITGARQEQMLLSA